MSFECHMGNYKMLNGDSGVLKKYLQEQEQEHAGHSDFA